MDARWILNILLPRRRTDDMRIWHYCKDGKYTVRSGYLLASEVHCRGYQSNGREMERWWKDLWSANIPTKMKVFSWKAFKDFLATGSTLSKRGMEVDTLCSMCGLVAESPLHAIWSYKSNKKWWAATPSPAFKLPVFLNYVANLLWWF